MRFCADARRARSAAIAAAYAPDIAQCALLAAGVIGCTIRKTDAIRLNLRELWTPCQCLLG